MRKHFLILMLFALLPLAGWAAEPLSSVKLSVANVTYGTATLNPDDDFLASWDADLVYGTDVIWDGKIYSNQACTTEVTDLATASVGTYYVKFTGGRYYEGTSVCQFRVLKAPLYVSILGDVTVNGNRYVGGNLLTTYGEAFDITDRKIEDVKGLKNEEDFEDVVSGSLTAVTVTETNANAEAGSTAGNVTKLANAKAYQATLSSFTSTNYELVCVDSFYIMRKDISDGEGLVFALNPNFTTYNGKIQDAAYTITYKGETLVQATRNKQGVIDKPNDFKVSYKVCETTTDPNTLKKTITGVTDDAATYDVINANIYATQIEGQGNFTGTYPAAEPITATSVYGNDPFVWTIKKAGLTIIALDQTKVYDTNTKLPHKYTAPTFDGQGHETTDPAVKAENNLVVTVLWPYGIGQEEANNIMQHVTVTTTDAKSDVGEYKITPSCSVAENTPNYEFNYVPGKFSITKRNLTITASDATKLYTASTNPAFGVAIYDGYDFELSNDERAAADGGDALLANLRKDIYVGHGTPAVDADHAAARTFLYKADDTDANKKGAGLKVELKANTPTTIGVHGGALEVKYSKYGLINNYNVTTVAGNFTISGGKIFVTALKQEKNYGADDPDWTPVKGVNYRIDGLIAADKNKDVTGLVLTREEGEDVGSYRIIASGATAPAGYLDIVYADGEFVINPRPITITVQNQTMKDGAKVSTLNTTAYTIDNTDLREGLAPGEAADEIFTLAFEDREQAASPATFKFSSWSAEKDGTKYTEGVAAFDSYSEEEGLTKIQVTENGTATIDNPGTDLFVGKYFYIEANPADGIPVARKQLYAANAKGQLTALDVWVKITKRADAVESADAAPIVGKVLDLGDDKNFEKFVRCIKVVAVDQAKFDNYAFTVNRGSLYLLDKDALVLDDQDEALAENIAAKNGEKRVFVAFGSRVLKAGQWNTLVLPFKTSVQELSETLGYVVVDRLNEENTDASTISIVLGFGDIPANTPFLVQPEADVDLADGIFFQKNIVYGGANPEAADLAGHKLVGTYEGVKLAAGSTTDYYYSTTYKEFRNPGANGTNIGKMRAYLKDESGSAARILIEEPNGDTSVTAIREVNAAEAVKAEGWYTINGIKLNAAPTQKGIYINNGKKIVVK